MFGPGLANQNPRPSSLPSFGGWGGVALLGASLLVYLPSWRGVLLFDDELFIAKNASIYSLANFPTLFTSSFPPEDPGRGLYRPLTALSYSLDIFLGGGQVVPEIFHLTQMFLYFGVGLLLWQLLVQWVGVGLPALGATLLFMVHPVHCEVVDALAGRSELLGLFFSLLSITLFWGSRGSWLRQGGALFCYALGCLAKESAVVLPGVLFCLTLLLEPSDERRQRMHQLRHLVPYLLVIPLYLLIRSEVLGRLTPHHTLLAGESVGTRLMTMGAIYLEYIRLWLIPTTYQVDFYYQKFPGIVRDFTPGAGVGLILLSLSLVSLGLVMGAAFRKGGAPLSLATRLMASGLAVYLIFLFPVSHVVPFGALMAERFLFAPSVGWVIGGLGAWLWWQQRGPITRGWTVVGVGILCLLGGRTWVRAGEWQNGETLNRSLAQALPEDKRAQRNRMAGLVDAGEFGKAVELGTHLIQMDPEYLPHHFNLGVAYLRLNQLDQARIHFDFLVSPPHDEPDGWYGLALLHLNNSDLPRAKLAVEQALRLNANYAQARELLPKVEASQAAAGQWRATHLEEARTSTDLKLVLRTALACRAVGDGENEKQLMRRVEELKQVVPPGEIP